MASTGKMHPLVTEIIAGKRLLESLKSVLELKNEFRVTFLVGPVLRKAAQPSEIQIQIFTKIPQNVILICKICFILYPILGTCTLNLHFSRVHFATLVADAVQAAPKNRVDRAYWQAQKSQNLA